MVKIKKVYHVPWRTYSFQHLFINKNSFANYFEYALIPYADNLKSICKITPGSDMSPAFYYIENNVIRYSVYSKLYSDLKADPYDYIDTEDIQILTTIVASRIEVSVIFGSVTDSFMWKNNLYYLQEIVQNILTVFTVTNSCIIPIHNIKEITDIGIYFIIVHSTGQKKCACKITKTTDITVRNVMSITTFRNICSVQSENRVAALKTQFDFLQKFVKAHIRTLPSSNSHKLSNKVLLIGPSGSGKTSLINYLATHMKTLLLTIDVTQLANPIYGKSEENLRLYFRQAALLAKEDQNGICIILLENVEFICQKITSKTGIHIKRLSYEFMNILDRSSNQERIIIIATTNNIHLLDPAVRRAGRLEIEVYINVPSEGDRYNILKLLCDKIGLKKSACKQVALSTQGYVGADLALIVHEVARLQSKHKSGDSENIELLNTFKNCIRKHRPASVRSNFVVNQPRNLCMKNIGGMESVKLELKSFIEWPLKYPKIYRRLGIPTPKGVLLYGPPGCAKTSLVCAIANSVNVTFLSVSAAELYSPFVGVTEQNVTELFNKARINSPSLLFIDEIDSLVGKREEFGKDIRQSVLSSFLTELDGVGNKVDITQARNTYVSEDSDNSLKNTPSAVVIVIAATNRPDKLDPAILRPGRFDKLLFVDLPDYQDRLNILQTIINNWKVPICSSVNLTHIAEKTTFYSGADLTNLIREAGFVALSKDGVNVESIKQEHLLTALTYVKSSVTTKQIEFYRNLSLNNY